MDQLGVFLDRFDATEQSFDRFFDRQWFAKNDIIFKQGADADMVYFIANGCIDLVIDKGPVTTLSPRSCSRALVGGCFVPLS